MERVLARALLISVLLILLSACKAKKPREVVYIAPELQPFVTQFKQDAEKYDRPLSITNLTAQLSDRIEDPAVGECARDAGTPIVRISRTFWSSASDAAKTLILYHELGHCVLGRDHEDTLILNDSIPRSLMATRELNVAVFVLHYDYYLCELFSGWEVCASTNKAFSSPPGM